jgi:chromosomal replication initiation ATPase DnaA
MWLLRQMKYSYPHIGVFMNRDRTTVMYGCEHAPKRYKDQLSIILSQIAKWETGK